MPEQVLVMLSDPDDARHAEINILDDVAKAEGLVEILLEAGFDRSRILVFVANEIPMQVRHRPVVTLARREVSAGAKATTNGASKTATTSRRGTAAREQDEGREPYQQNGVRFSTAFRSA
jgi:hypothetical protein